jgi:hypothetical protein
MEGERTIQCTSQRYSYISTNYTYSYRQGIIHCQDSQSEFGTIERLTNSKVNCKVKKPHSYSYS